MYFLITFIYYREKLGGGAWLFSDYSPLYAKNSTRVLENQFVLTLLSHCDLWWFWVLHCVFLLNSKIQNIRIQLQNFNMNYEYDILLILEQLKQSLEWSILNYSVKTWQLGKKNFRIHKNSIDTSFKRYMSFIRQSKL